MKLSLNSKPLILQPDTLVGLRRAKNVRVRVSSGVLWITVTGLSEDVVLAAGDQFAFPNHALVLLEAPQACELAFETPRNRLSCWRGLIRERVWPPRRGGLVFQ